MLGVWSIHHGQLLQTLVADPVLQAHAAKAKGTVPLSTSRLDLI